VSWQQASVLSIALGLCVGCAEHLRAIDHSAGWSTGVLFWPPPRATAIWTAESSSSTLGDAAQLIAGTLREAGYADQRWLPVGAHYEHGFAVSTRLEKIAEGGTPKSAVESTAMEGPDFRATELPARRRAPHGCRVRMYIYECETSAGDHDRALVAHDDKVPAHRRESTGLK
jgi:hypothetical protein